ncbi:MAG: prephenate dehydrogenase/arogenate dehydrogenase family protein [Anaerolineales bacterium]|jgi:prephenate dehydrogenase
MAFEVLFIGLDQAAASISAALGDQEDVIRIGYDPDMGRAKELQKAGLLDKTSGVPRKAASSADLVLISLPPAEVIEFLDLLNEDLKQDAVVIDLTPLKAGTLAWVDEHKSDDWDYIGATPIVGPQALVSPSGDEPMPDLFEKGLMAIMVPPEAQERSIGLALNLADIIGAAPFFVDPFEHDAAFAMSFGMPALLSAALIRASAQSAAWEQIQRLAGSEFAVFSRISAQHHPKKLHASLRLSRTLMAQRIDVLMEELAKLRQLLLSEEGDEQLLEYLDESSLAYDKWIDDRSRHSWVTQGLRTDLRNTAGLFGNLTGGLFSAGDRFPKKD